jgi:putative hydrolase of the HAD superfamily
VTLKALMVDVDGVVVAHPPGKGWSDDLLADLGLDPSKLVEVFFTPNFDDIVHGRCDMFERLEPALAQIAPHVTAHQLVDYWFAKDSPLDITLLNDLAATRAGGLQLHLATVQEHHRARYLWETLALKDRFDAMHYAADLGCKKPHPDFYARIGERTGLAPHEMRLIDDKLDNVQAAVAAGWSGFHWVRGSTLKQALA